MIKLLLSFALAASAPIQSKEEIQFTSKKEQFLLDFGQSKDFVGVMTRTYEKNSGLKNVDLYAFKDTSKISLDEELCKGFLEKIYGPLGTTHLQVKKIEVFVSHTGKTCEAVLHDNDRTATFPEYRTYIGFLKAKPYGIVFRLTKRPSASTVQDMKKFWDTLR